MHTTLDVTVNRILNFFIYLEIMQMVSIFFQTEEYQFDIPYLNDRLARYISLENLDGREAIFITGSIFLISLALVGLAYRTKIVRSTPSKKTKNNLFVSIELPQSPQRIVCLTEETTELLYKFKSKTGS